MSGIELSSFPDFCVESLNTWRVLRSLGFTADELWFVAHAESGVVGVQVNAQGQTIQIGAGRSRLSKEETERIWVLCAETFSKQAFNLDELNASLFTSRVFLHRKTLVCALVAKGFRVPSLPAGGGV